LKRCFIDTGDHMSDHQPFAYSSDPDTDVAMAPDEGGGKASQGAVTDQLEPDFSRLRLARASLDAAFPEE
jgi:hypothetical protein